MNPAVLLEFWCSDRVRPHWFERSDLIDREIAERFGGWIDPAKEGALARWEAEPDAALALVLLLDQFPRHIHRGQARAFAYDAAAREAAGRAIARGFDLRLPLDRRYFLYLPYEHSESLADQQCAVALFRGWVDAQEGETRPMAEEQFRYVLRHEEIVRRFGRFPHRNAALGRETTPAEQEFLKQPMSSF